MQDFENIIIKSLLFYMALLFVSLGIIFCFQGYSDMVVSLLIPLLDIWLVKIFFWRYGECSDKKFIILIFSVSLVLRLAGVFVMGRILEAYNGMPFVRLRMISFTMKPRWKS